MACNTASGRAFPALQHNKIRRAGGNYTDRVARPGKLIVAGSSVHSGLIPVRSLTDRR